MPVLAYFKVLMNQLNGRLQELCMRTDSLFLPQVYQAVEDEKRPFALRPEFTRDGCHFNHVGYEVIGNLLSDSLHAKLKEGDRVLLLGDSITAGYPEYEPVMMGEEAGDETHSFGYYLKNNLGVEVANKGISGDFTSSMVDRLEEYLEPEPVLTILQGGANDAFASLSLGAAGLNQNHALDVAHTIYDNFEAMVQRCQSADVPVALIPLLPFYTEGLQNDFHPGR